MRSHLASTREGGSTHIQLSSPVHHQYALQAPLSFFNFIGDNYAISDSYHQAVMGGTGANHIMPGTGDAAFYSDGHGNPRVNGENLYQPTNGPAIGNLMNLFDFNHPRPRENTPLLPYSD